MEASASEEEQSLVNPDWYQVRRGSTAIDYPENWRSLNGSVDKNSIVMGDTHEGKKGLLWECKPDATGGASGGFNNGGGDVPIDSRFTTRLTIPVFKKGGSGGSTYLGMRSKNAAGVSLATRPWDGTTLGAPTTNFYNGALNIPQNKWFLMVGYLRSHVNLDEPAESGLFEIGTGVKTAVFKDGVMHPDTVSFSMRAYLFYTNNAGIRQYFGKPRIDRMDGNQKPLSELLLI